MGTVNPRESRQLFIYVNIDIHNRSKN
jgi:hypothetical protein